MCNSWMYYLTMSGIQKISCSTESDIALKLTTAYYDNSQSGHSKDITMYGQGGMNHTYTGNAVLYIIYAMKGVPSVIFEVRVSF